MSARGTVTRPDHERVLNQSVRDQMHSGIEEAVIRSVPRAAEARVGRALTLERLLQEHPRGRRTRRDRPDVGVAVPFPVFNAFAPASKC